MDNQQPNSNLSIDETSAQSQLLSEQQRQQTLQPYLVTRVRRGIIGSSRYAQRLRQDIRQATNTTKHPPILITGEPGLEKDNIAALIHFGSDRKRQPLIKIEAKNLKLPDLFGRASGKPGLLDWLGQGTLLINNWQDLSAPLQLALQQLIETGNYSPVAAEGSPTGTARQSSAWIIVNSEKAIDLVIQRCSIPIKVPPLRVRKADIESQINYYISLSCRKTGQFRPRLAPEALRRLQTYDFPGNLAELEGLVNRAIVQASCAPLLTEEIFWPAQAPKKRWRLNLLNSYPWLRNWLRSDWWPDRINFGFTSWIYVIVVLLLFLGPQTRDQNIALNLFWAWWWPLVLLTFPLVGRLWCAVCPFMIYGEIVQKLRQILFPSLPFLPWPRVWAERWGGWILFAGFAAILLWEELWNLENTAYLSGWLLLIITAGAMIGSLLFERRFWCRYLCPIGGMNGLYAKLSIIELRAQQGICSASCNTYQCYKGGPAKGEGQDTNGCPVYSHPAQLTDNRNCVLCMTCLKACPHRSVEVNLRPPGIELWTSHLATNYEVALLFLLLGSVAVHHLSQICELLQLPVTALESWPIHAGLTTLALLLPGIVAFSCDFLAVKLHRSSPDRPFRDRAYAYLPLVLCANLSHYLQLGLTEAGAVVPVTLATFGLPSTTLPSNLVQPFIAHPAVVAFLQGSVLLAGGLLAIALLGKISRQPWLQLAPQLGVIGGFTILLWHLILV
jgi:transcriptional regulator with AAA-type ATPase domain/NAD-dependent dihydropyrimidine dehydrogenase PreA subunit